MKIPRSSPLVAVPLLAVCVAGPSWSGGTPADTCRDAYTEAQVLRKEGKLVASLRRLIACSSQQCPGWMIEHCAKWMSEVEDALPSVVVEARDTEGHDLSDVRLLVDGAELVARLDGSAIAIDPGPHTLRFERGAAGVEQSLVVREGEHHRRIPVTFPAPAVTPPPLAPRIDPLPAPPSVPVATLVLSGIGAASLTASAIVGIIAKRQFFDLAASCSPRCDPARTVPVRNRMIGADVALGVGIVALGAAIIVWLARPKAPAAPPAPLGGR